MNALRFLIGLLFSGLTVCGLHAQTTDGFNPKVNGLVFSIALQADGRVLVGGDFTTVGGLARNCVARLNVDGTVDASFTPGTNDDVRTLAVQADGKILVGGFFTTVNGVTRNRIARINADGTVDAGFNPNTDNQVNSLAIQTDGKILLGGFFTSVGGVVRNRIARINPDGTLDTGFNPNANSQVIAMALQSDGKIVIGGGFTAVGGGARNGIARLNTDGTLDASFNPNANAGASALAVQADGKILMGGGFTTVGGVARNYLARLNTDGTLDTSLRPSAIYPVSTFVGLADGRILFDQDNYLFRTNVDGTHDSGFSRYVDGITYAIAVQADGKILVGGGFTSLNGVGRNNLGRLTSYPAVSALAVTGTDRLDWTRGGSAPEVGQVTFDGWNGSEWVSLGAANPVSGGWSKTGLSLPTSGWIRACGRTAGGFLNGSSGIISQTASYGAPATPDVTVSVDGGELSSGASTLNLGTLQWPSSGNAKTVTLTNSGDATLSGLALALVGSNATEFSHASLSSTTLAPGSSVSFSVDFIPQTPGTKAARLAIMSNDPDETPFDISLGGVCVQVDPAFNPGVSGILGSVGTPCVSALAIQDDGKVVFGGAFKSVGGVGRSSIARLNADGTLDLSFDPGTGGSSGVDGNPVVFALAEQADGKILMGGAFTLVSGVARNRIARLNPDGTLDPGFNPNADGQVNALAVQADGKILIGGYFTTVGGVARNRIARLNPDGSLDTGFNPNAGNYVRTIVMQADGKTLIGGAFGTVGGVARNSIARLNPDGSLDASFNPNANNHVYSLAMQADGKILVGGGFTTMGGLARNRIARLNADGTPDGGFNPNAGNLVYSIAVQSDGKIVLGGEFVTVGGVARNRIACLNSDGSLDNGFNPNADSLALAVAIQADGRALAGGYFATVGGFSRGGIVRLSNHPAASVLTIPEAGRIDWTRGGSAPEVEQVGFESWDGGSWVNLGAATRVAGGWSKTGVSLPPSGWIRARGRVAGGMHNGSSGIVMQTSSYAEPAAPVITVSVEGNGNLPYGSAFVEFGAAQWPSPAATRTITITNVGNASLTGLALRLEGAHSGDFSVTDLPFTSLAPGTSVSIAVGFAPWKLGTRVARLAIIGNDPVKSPFEISLVGRCVQADSSFNPDGSGSITPNGVVAFCSLATQTDGKVLVSGHFSKVGGVVRNRVARLTPDGRIDTGYNPNVNGDVYSLTVQADGKALIGGGFTTVGGMARNRIARINPDGTPETGFDPNANEYVYSLAIQPDGKILAGGSFTTMGGFARNYIARISSDGTLDTNFNPDANGGVLVLAVQPDGGILMGGGFTTVGGVARNRVARVNPDGTLDAGFNPNVGNSVHSLAVQADGKILIGGDFSQVGGVARRLIARLHPDGTLDAVFNPQVGGGGAYPSVSSLALQADGKIILGGSFSIVSGVARNNIARLNTDGTLDTTFDPDANNTIGAIAVQADGRILVCGGFTTVGGVAQMHISRLTNEPATSALSVTGTARIDWLRGGSGPEVEQVTFEYLDGSVWTFAGMGVRVAGGWRITGLSLPVIGQIRARGRTSGGDDDGDSGLVEQVESYADATPRQLFDIAASAAGLIGSEALPEVAPHHDGVPNLLKYAFNMEMSAPALSAMAPGTGTAGLPVVTVADGSVRFEFLRRKGSGLLYTPQRSAGLVGSAWQDIATQPTIVAVSANWERLAFELPSQPGADRQFFRVQVTLQ